MIQPTPGTCREIKTFVRNELECACPDEVFSLIHWEMNPDAFAGLPVDCLIRVGGRLLIAVCKSSEIGAWSIVSLLITGRNLRDRLDFNRFRLVIVSDDPERDFAEYQARFSEMTGMDEKVHLHVVNPSAIAGFLS